MLPPIICGAIAGIAETIICHPIDVIKTYMQQKRNSKSWPIHTIYQKQGWSGFYRGIDSMMVSIPFKNAFRFGCYEFLSEWFSSNRMINGVITGCLEFIIINPLDVCKIRVQAQYHSTYDRPIRYKNGFDALIKIIRQEGWYTLYRGSSLTILRQGINQGTNFYVFYHLKEEYPKAPHALLGLISGCIGPILNNPIDVIRTRTPLYGSVHEAVNSVQHWTDMYKGLGMRLLRIGPGQAITFTVYEYMKTL